MRGKYGWEVNSQFDSEEQARGKEWGKSGGRVRMAARWTIEENEWKEIGQGVKQIGCHTVKSRKQERRYSGSFVDANRDEDRQDWIRGRKEKSARLRTGTSQDRNVSGQGRLRTGTCAAWHACEATWQIWLKNLCCAAIVAQQGWDTLQCLQKNRNLGVAGMLLCTNSGYVTVPYCVIYECLMSNFCYSHMLHL